MSEPARTAQTSVPAAIWLWAIGSALMVFAARCREIQLHAGYTPFLDQWRVEAQQILVPWLRGQLSWTAFFAPHHEHFPVWTRLLAWLEAAVLGRWDPLLQCTINAGLWGLTIGLWSHWLRRMLPITAAVVMTAMAILLAALPYGWENTTWGFQSHIPLALLLITCHIHGSFAADPLTGRWWGAQLCGFAALFTLGSMWAAPLAVLIVLLWTADYDRRRMIAALVLTAIGLTLLLYARSTQPHAGALAQSVTTLPQFLAALLVQLGWPSAWPAAAALWYAPSILLAWQIRGRPSSSVLDRVVLAVACWAAAQAVAFAFARGGGWIGFVSRYGDLLAWGVLANAIALWRLCQGLRRARILLGILVLAWGWALIPGLHWVSTRSHTEYFHQHSALWALLRGEAVKGYLATKSIDTLSTPEARGLLYPDPAAVAEMLDTPGLSPLLPVQLRPDARREKGDFISAVATRLRSIWPTLASSGAILFALSWWLLRKPATAPVPALIPTTSGRAWPWLAVGTAAVFAALFLWPMPLNFNATQRWQKMLVPPDYAGALSFLITTPTTYAVDNLTGGAALWPEDFRNTFYGTHIDGPGFTGSARSSLFPLSSPWLVMPIAGFPASPGNAISLRIENPDGSVLAEIHCAEPNPISIGFWQVDVRPYAGKQARIILNDGRTDEAGWVAAASPQPTDSSRTAAKLNSAWDLERTTSAHRSLGILAAILFVSLVSVVFRDWLRRGKR